MVLAGVAAVLSVAALAVGLQRFAARLSEGMVRRPWLLPRDRVIFRDGDPERVPARFRVGPRPEHLDRERRVASVRTRDDAFDARYLAEGDEATVLAALSRDTRALLLAEADELEIEIQGGVVTVAPRPHARAGELARAEAVLRRVVEATSFAERELPARLLANLEVETEPEAALRTFELLTSGGYGDEAAEAAVAIACRAVEPRLHLRGVARSGPEGRELLARYAADAARPDLVRAEALARHGQPAALGAGELTRWLASAGPLLTEAIAGALAELDGPGVEEALLSLVAHHAERVRVAAVKALGKNGTARAWAVLSSVARDDAAPPAVRMAVAVAMDRVRGRVEGAGAGQLSLAEDAEAGRVSLAAAEAGALSPAGDGAG